MIDRQDLLIALCLLLSAATLAYNLWVWRLIRVFRFLEPRPKANGTDRSVGVVVPARDEQDDVEASLRSLLAQPGVDLKIVLVNDGSSDATGRIADRMAAEDKRLQVLHDPELPTGWLGKTNALHQGAALLEQDFLMFADADVIHAPGGLAAAIDEIKACDQHFISLLPRFEWRSLFENCMMPAMMAAIPIFSSSRIDDPDDPSAVAAGAFMLMRRQAYLEIGGHKSLRAEVVDDVGLARAFKRRGYRVGIRMAPRCLRVRMFKGNRHAFWGMTKNTLATFEGRPWMTLLIAPLLLGPLLCGPLAALAGLWWSSWPLVVCGLLLYLTQYLGLYSVWRMHRFDPLRALAFPLATLSMGATLLWATWLTYVRGEVLWRGRAVKIKKGS